jgi:CubicO group peptidase (beta-lactamase class C family)
MTSTRELPSFRIRVRVALVALLATLLSASSGSALPQSAASELPAYSLADSQSAMRRWLLLGPLPAEKEVAEAVTARLLDQEAGPPREGEAVEVGEHTATWRWVESERDIVDLARLLVAAEDAIAYALAAIDVATGTEAVLGVGSDDSVRAWIGEELVHEHKVARPVRMDDDIVPLSLSPGRNRLLLEIRNGSGEWGFVCRTLDADALGERLGVAAARGDLEEIALLIDRGADLDHRDAAGATPLHIARRKGRAEAESLLLERGADADTPAPAPADVVDAAIEALIDADGPGVAVLASASGKVLYERVRGLASVELGVPLTPATRFRIGSVTKQFTAAAILTLAERGSLSVDDPLSRFFPEFPRGDEVTLRHLLTHTSGIHSYTDEPEFLEEVTLPADPDELIDEIEGFTYDFEPGLGWRYSNSGYFLLGRIVEIASSRSYGEFLEETFFAPLGMDDTGVVESGAVIPSSASGYGVQAGRVRKALDWDMTRAGGAGALYSTVRDLQRWNEALFAGEVLSAESLAAALSPVELGEDVPAADNQLGMIGGGYGFGWIISEFRGRSIVEHGGGLHGFVSHLARIPELELTVVVLSNAAPPPPGFSPSDLSREVVEAFAGKRLAPRETREIASGIDTSVYDDYVGQYDMMSMIFTITREGDRLYAQLRGQPRLQIFPRTETEFFAKRADVSFTFVREGEGPVQRLIVNDRGRKLPAQRMDPQAEIDVDAKRLDDYVGRYDYGMGVRLTVTREGDQLFAKLSEQPRFRIFPSGADTFFWKVVNARITFVRDEQGVVTGAIHEQGGRRIEVSRID